jgi:hypothetical protein
MKGLLFGDDLFQFQFDARGILVPGKVDEVCDERNARKLGVD